MGVDFIRKAAATFKKSWDRRRVELGTPDLLTVTPESSTETAAASIREGVSLQPGDAVTVQFADGDLIALQGVREVAQLLDPPPELVQAVRDSYGVARGRVEQVHEIAAVAELSIC